MSDQVSAKWMEMEAAKSVVITAVSNAAAAIDGAKNFMKQVKQEMNKAENARGRVVEAVAIGTVNVAMVSEVSAIMKREKNLKLLIEKGLQVAAAEIFIAEAAMNRLKESEVIVKDVGEEWHKTKETLCKLVEQVKEEVWRLVVVVEERRIAKAKAEACIVEVKREEDKERAK